MIQDSIEFIPPSAQRNVLGKLNELIEKSIELKGLVCYWTIPHEILHDSFAKKISDKGFIAIDIHEPTNIDSLVPLVEMRSNIFLHLYKTTGTSEFPGTRKLPSYLMHSKIFFFKINSQRAIIWIGSHNATNRALQGGNIESSVLVTTALKSDFCRSVIYFLDEVKARCDLMNLSLINYYKWLQGRSNDRKVIELLDCDNLAQEGFKFALFVSSYDDAKGLKIVGDRILISVTKNDGEELFFSATIGQSGRLTGYPNLGFSIQYYAHRKERRIPSIKMGDNFELDKVKKSSEYFAVFTLDEKQIDSKRFVEPIKDRWAQTEDLDIYFPELNSEIKPSRRNFIAIKKAVSPDRFLQLHRDSLRRRNDANRSLVTRVTEIAVDDNDI
jgi:hypothetical protein